jgi:2-polyprenyl-3-methyl-5-hydroxy-6-metoxy-1,4-benzoquinol methylase
MNFGKRKSVFENETRHMDYKDFQRDRWNSLALEFGDNNPLRAVISKDSDQVNYYFDKITKRMLRRSLRLEDKRVLDLGCGIGRLSVWMASKAQHVTGVDISEEMTRVARNAAVSQGLHNTAFHLYDGTTVPFSDGSFDVIVCSGVLKYVIEDEDFSRVIGEMCRTVVRGGQIAVIDQFDYAGPVQLVGEEDIGGLSVLRRPTDYISLFQKNGMEVVEQCSMYRKRFLNLGETVLAKLPLGRFIAAQPLIFRAMATVDVRVDEVLRHRVRPMRGFQLLSFVRR